MPPSYSFVRRVASSVVLLISCALNAIWAQQDSAYIAQHYQTREFQIPMRDGVKLFTIVYLPRDTSQTYPIILSRTPYGAYNTFVGPSPELIQEGYIFVTQDVRGRYQSEGQFVQMRPLRVVKRRAADIDESTDAYDTIDWLVKNLPRNNGNLGLWGISYAGFYAAMGLIDAHPALKAVSPQAPQTDWFLGDDTHHNGAFLLASTFNFMAACGRVESGTAMTCGDGFDFGTDDGYQFFLNLGSLANVDAKYFKRQVPGWTEMMEHGTYDAFWQARNILPHMQHVTPAVLTVGGWYDANNLYGALHLFLAIDHQSPNTDNAIVIGPWSHGQWLHNEGKSVGELELGTATTPEFRHHVLSPFFAYHLKGKGAIPGTKAYVFETGANRWRAFHAWPPKGAVEKALYLGESKALSMSPPRTSGADPYISDPAHPVPFVPGKTTDMDQDYMARDQRFLAGRSDVLVYQGGVLTEPVTLAGPVAPSLFVATTGTDGDWVVKLIDVHQNGFQELVRGDVIRAKFRNSMEKPTPLTPGKITKLDFVMTDVLHTFPKGHRMMVQVQSSWFPLVDRNPQTFVDIYNAKPEDFRITTQEVHRGAAASSRIVVRVIASPATP